MKKFLRPLFFIPAWLIMASLIISCNQTSNSNKDKNTSTTTDTTSDMNDHSVYTENSDKSIKLRSDMHKLWTDHVVWTRNVILNIMDDLPGTDQAVARLLKNQDDIGNAIKPVYGDAAGVELTRLLKEHITQAADLLKAAKADNTTAFNDINAKWKTNADQIATFLSNANPNWKLDDMKKMMQDHLSLTTDEAVARKKKDYAGDVAAYDKVYNEILMMSDMLTDGILKQYPEKFK